VPGFTLDFIVDVDVAVDDFDFFSGTSDEAFDEVFFGQGGVFEDDDVPGFWFGELIEIF